MNEIALWEETKSVLKEMYARKLTEAEFAAFLLVARKLGLDPASREIVPQVREGQNGRQVNYIISRDGYLKAAMRDPDYAGIQSMVVREGDEFEIIPSEGRVVHRFGPKRGAILGAWAIAYHKKRPPVIYFADFQEYVEANKHSPTWKQYPSAMIQKVAEVGALRRQFNLSGVLAAEEIGAVIEEEGKAVPLPASPSRAQVVPLASGEGVPKAALPPEERPITAAQAAALKALAESLGLDREAVREVASRAVERDLQSARDLTEDEADELVIYLDALAGALEGLSPEERGKRIRAWLAAHERGLPDGEDLTGEEQQEEQEALL